MDERELIPAGPVRPTGLPVGVPPSEVPEPAGFTEEVEADPEEQAQLEQVVAKVGQFIWGKGNRTVVDRLNQSDQEVHKAVGETAYKLVKAEFDKAKAAGVELPAELGEEALAEYVIPWLFELGEAARIFPEMDGEREQKEMADALYEAHRLHGESLLNGPDRDLHVSEAQDLLSRGIAEEADRGELAPEFQNMLQSMPGRTPTPMASGVQRGMQEMSRGA